MLKHIVILDVLTIAIGFVLRAVGGSVRDRRRDQPVAARLHDPAGAVHRAGQAAARTGAAGRRRHGAPSDSGRVQRVPARPDDLGGHGVDAGRVHLLHHQSRDAGEVRDGVARTDDSVSDLRDLPVPLPGAPPRGRRQSGRAAAHGPPAAGLRRVVGGCRWRSSSIGRRDGSLRPQHYGRLQHSIRFGQRRADHGADPRADPRQARRRLHRAADPASWPPSRWRSFSTRAASGRTCSRNSAGCGRRSTPPVRPNYVFDETTLFETHRAPIRWIRRLLLPILKLFFNPNPLIQALHIQSQLNTMQAQAEARAARARTGARSADVRGHAQPRRSKPHAWGSR